MYNNKQIIPIKPLIFTKKLRDSYKIIPFNKISSTLGHMRYFPPATQEWFNSIYSYNKNYIKDTTISENNLSRLIKSYFNLYFSNRVLQSKRIVTRLRRFTINKIFFSKAELKHTSNKVIITLYVYNEERRILMNRIRNIETKIFSFINTSKDKKRRRSLSIKEKLDLIKNIKIEEFNSYFIDWLNKLNSSINKKKKNSLLTIENLKDKVDEELELVTLKNKTLFFKTILALCIRNIYYNTHYKEIFSKILKKTLLEKEILIISYYKLLLSLNKSKFEDKFLFLLKPLISRIYNKDVEFNIVNLKAIYLNSDIFTEVIAFKLRDRNNGLLKVLKSFLYMVKLPKTNLLKEKLSYINPKSLWENKVKNLTLNNILMQINKINITDASLFHTRINNKDYLNNILKDIYACEASKASKQENIPTLVLQDYDSSLLNKDKPKINFLTSFLNNLNYKNIGGVRLEAKGRLTRRLTASRSVFKIRWKGSLKNMDSSYRGLSSVILRGHVKSNVRYSIVNSKTRNGSFGLKGWISGKK